MYYLTFIGVEKVDVDWGELCVFEYPILNYKGDKLAITHLCTLLYIVCSCPFTEIRFIRYCVWYPHVVHASMGAMSPLRESHGQSDSFEIYLCLEDVLKVRKRRLYNQLRKCVG